MMFARSAARFTPRICKLYSSRGYADQMDLTFVSQNKVELYFFSIFNKHFLS